MDQETLRSCDDLIAIRTKLHLTQAAKNRRSLSEGRLTSLKQKMFFDLNSPTKNGFKKRLAFLLASTFAGCGDSCALRNMTSSIRFGDGFFDFEWFSTAKGFC